MTLVLAAHQCRDIVASCINTYPEEACGAFLGTIAGREYRVKSLVDLKNAGEGRENWFEVDPRDLLRIERAARAMGCAVIGFYHSHPNAAPNPSKADLERSWPVYSYLIVAVRGKPEGGFYPHNLPKREGTENSATAACSDSHTIEFRCWLQNEDGSGFDEEPVEILD